MNEVNVAPSKATRNVGTDGNSCILYMEHDKNEDRADRNNDMPNAKYRMSEGKINENGARVSGEFLVQGILRHVETEKQTKYVSDGRDTDPKRTLHSHQVTFCSILLSAF